MKRITLVVLLAVLALSTTGVAFAAETYNVDNGHSFVSFTVKHMSVSSVRGEFKDYSADLTVDEADLGNSSINLKIDAASIDTRDEKRDGHLRSADFFEVETYPEIVFKSTKIEKTESGRFWATGDLTIKETTQEVVIDLEINGPIKDPYGNHRVGAEGSVTIDRQEFGVKFSRLMDNGGLVVGDDVQISFSLEASRKAE
jgi:polyisoprenoid-binding protein YceI